MLDVGSMEDLLGGDDKETRKAKESETKNADFETPPQQLENDQVFCHSINSKKQSESQERTSNTIKQVK